MPYYSDPQRSAYAAFASMTVPRVYLADRNRVIRYMWVNELGMDGGALTEIVKGLIENP